EANEDGHRAFTSAATAVRRTLYEGIGGPDTKDDPELGRRLWHAGALFVPDRDAPAWRTASPGRDGVDPWSDAGRPGGRGAVQPLVRAVIDVEGAPYDMVRACVDRLLDGTESDLDVALAADWDAREEPGGDPMDLRLLQAAYLTDPRVGFTARPPGTGFPAPFVLRLPVVWGVAPDTLAVMVARAERARAGLVELIPDPRGGNDAGVRLWRTRALLRGMRDRREEEGLAEAVESVYGRYRIQCGPGALTDLTDPEARRYRSAALRAKPPVPPPAPPADTGPPGGRGRPAAGEEPPACTAPPPPGRRCETAGRAAVPDRALARGPPHARSQRGRRRPPAGRTGNDRGFTAGARVAPSRTVSGCRASRVRAGAGKRARHTVVFLFPVPVFSTCPWRRPYRSAAGPGRDTSRPVDRKSVV